MFALTETTVVLNSVGKLDDGRIRFWHYTRAIRHSL